MNGIAKVKLNTERMLKKIGLLKNLKEKKILKLNDVEMLRHPKKNLTN